VAINPIVPDGTTVNTFVVSGAATAHAATSDNSDTTTLQDATGGSRVQLTLSTFTIPAGSYVKDLSVIVRASAGIVGPTIRSFDTWLQVPTGFGSGVLQLHGSGLYAYGTTPTDYASIGFGGFFDSVMTQNQVDNMQVIVQAGVYETQQPTLSIYKITTNVYTVVLPTVSGASIAFADGSLRPRITWTTTNPDLGAVYYHIKVFTAAQVADPFFLVENTTPVWDSGDVLSGVAQPSARVGVDLVPGTSYIVYIKVGDTTGWTRQALNSGVTTGITPPAFVTNNVWYVSNALQIPVIAPARPLLVATDQPNNVVGGPRVQLDVTLQDNLLRRAESYDTSIQATNSAYGWMAFDGNTAPSAVFAGSPMIGQQVFKVQRTASIGDARVTTDYAGATVNGLQSTWLRPVVAGRTYLAIVQVRSPATSRTAQVEIDWFNSSGTFLSTSTLGAISTSTTGWKRAGDTVVAPANAAFARYGIRFVNCAINEIHYFHVAVFRPYDNGDTYLTDAVIHPAGAGFASTNNKLNANDATGSPQSLTDQGYGGPFNIVNGTVAYNAAGGRHGLNVQRATSAAAGALTFGFGTGQSAGGIASYFPVPTELNATFYVSAWMKAAAVANLTMFVGIRFRDSAGNVLSTTLGTSQLSVVGTFVQCTCSVSGYPVGTVYAEPIYGFVASAASQVIDMDTLQFTDTAVNWQPGGANSNAYGSGVVSTADSSTRVVRIEKSVDGGVTWNPVRGAYNYIPVGITEPQTFQAWDYEFVSGIALQYRASVIGYYQGVPYSSAYYTVGLTPALTTSGTNPKRWWLKDPLTPANSMQVDILQDSFKYKETEAQAKYDPLGRNRNIIVADVIYGKEFSLTLDFLVEAEFDAFRALRNLQRVLLLQRQWSSDQWYVRVQDVIEIDEFNTTPIRYQVALTAIEVDVP
jgi:hypothetical protein